MNNSSPLLSRLRAPDDVRPTRLLRKAWDGWLKLALILGTVQMTIILTVVYWLFITVLFIPFGLLADPLRLRRRNGGWVPHHQPADVPAFLHSQG